MTPAIRVSCLSVVAVLALAGALGLAQSASARGGGELEVRVANVKDARGHVHVDICTADEFLRDCHISADVPAVVGVTVVSVRDLPAGVYAVQAYHDVNDNQRVDRDLFGIPREGVGFSNNPHLLFKAPKFANAAFMFDGQQGAVDVTLRYFAH